ncbi:MAG: NTP transferase domain-containing protein, partial [Xanthomonadales bacterium]|nr:NTP transferase domain-containing protein [Xanthomonadales bacterium]
MQRIESGAAGPYPEPIDAIVLAGTDDNPKRLIQDSNKAFLEIGGQVLVRRVVGALLDATFIAQIFVVGPSGRLRGIFQGLPEVLGRQVTVVQQSGKMLANAWKAIHASEARYRERHGTDDPQRPLLFISSDLPLISAAAVDDFVRRCAREDRLAASGHSMLAGVAEEASLRRFYPEHGKPGIERPFVHLDGCRLRLANIYVGRPRTLSEQQFLQTGFDHRKAEKWKNVLALAWKFLAQPG